MAPMHVKSLIFLRKAMMKAKKLNPQILNIQHGNVLLFKHGQTLESSRPTPTFSTVSIAIYHWRVCTLYIASMISVIT